MPSGEQSPYEMRSPVGGAGAVVSPVPIASNFTAKRMFDGANAFQRNSSPKK